MNALYQFTDVTKRYADRVVLSVPELAIDEGERVAVIGPSGAGKSTLLRLLGLLELPTTGTVCYAGRPTSGSLPISLRREVTMMFQRPLLLDATVERNVAYGLRLRGERDTRQAVNDALRLVGLGQLAAAKAKTLSGGEQQRVALARALILRPRVLLLDEPTAHLDPHNVALIEEAISELYAQHRTTVILATHNLHQAHRLTERAIMLLDGKLIESGWTAMLLNSPADERTRAFVRGGMVV